jgi:archaellum component FlaC
MAEPTLKDVLDAISTMQGEISSMKDSISTMQGEISTIKTELRRVDAKVDTVSIKVDTATIKVDNLTTKVDAHRDETAKGFRELDEELSKHSSTVHRQLEEDIAALKRQPKTRPARRARTR